MKVKIQQTTNTVTPKYVFDGVKSIFSLKIIDRFKWLTLPVRITPPLLDRSRTFLLFYDGSVEGRTVDSQFASLGAAFMPSLYSTEPFYASAPGYTAGWTAGTPLGHITGNEIRLATNILAGQGLTTSSTGYIWLNFETPWENYILFSGYTGPSTLSDITNQGIASNFYGKLLKGGMGSDGQTFNGLKQYFPGVSFGIYGQPRWTYYLLGSDIWTLPESQINSAINFAADIWLGCTALADAVDLLMPSVYSGLNAPEANRLFSRQNVKLAKKINEKLEQAGKGKKKIIPFIAPVYYTDQTGSPYIPVNYGPGYMEFKYIPPYTIFLDQDSRHECIEPVVQEGADGLIVWNGDDYPVLTATRTVFAPGVAEDTVISSGSGSWRQGPTAGVPNPWSYRAIQRQAISAHENYTRGVCMGITGNRWWWRAGPETETYTPPEWKPLGVNPIQGSTTSATTLNMVKRIYTDAIYRQLNLAKTIWSENN